MMGEITNFELLLTRGRAMGICFLTAEQVPSEISRAARQEMLLPNSALAPPTAARAEGKRVGGNEHRRGIG